MSKSNHRPVPQVQFQERLHLLKLLQVLLHQEDLVEKDLEVHVPEFPRLKLHPEKHLDVVQLELLVVVPEVVSQEVELVHPPLHLHLVNLQTPQINVLQLQEL